MTRTLAQLDMSGSAAGVLDALSTSYGLVELHDRNYLNGTSDEEEGSHEYFEEDGDDTSIKERMKQWSTYQPHFITKYVDFTASLYVLLRPDLMSTWWMRPVH
jgi:hypothetical protein